TTDRGARRRFVLPPDRPLERGKRKGAARPSSSSLRGPTRLVDRGRANRGIGAGGQAADGAVVHLWACACGRVQNRNNRQLPSGRIRRVATGDLQLFEEPGRTLREDDPEGYL